LAHCLTENGKWKTVHQHVGDWTSPSLTDRLESLSKIEQRPVDKISNKHVPKERSKATAANERRRTWFRIVALTITPLALLFRRRRGSQDGGMRLRHLLFAHSDRCKAGLCGRATLILDAVSFRLG
jgi:hypothetical protein